MTFRELRVVVAFALTAVPNAARADENLVVTRGDGATDCPDAEQVRALALAAVAPSLPPPTHAYHVSFERSEESFRAEVVDDTAGRTRRLEDTDARCDALGEAVALVVATMWGSEHDDAAPTPAPAPPTPIDRPPVPAPARPRDLHWVFGAGPSLAVAIVRPAAAALVGDAAIELANASLAVGALWIPEQRTPISPGSVGVQLLSASLRGCAFVGSTTHLGLCASVLAGALGAKGNGYSVDMQRTRPWLAVEPGAFVDQSLLWGLRGRAAAGAIVPLYAETFSVVGAGVAYPTPPVGGLLSLSLELQIP